MKKNKTVPLRKCVVTNERLPKQELLRVVRSKDGAVHVDPTGKMNGRGAYVKRDKRVIAKAKKTKKLERQLNATVPEELYEEMVRIIDES